MKIKFLSAGIIALAGAQCPKGTTGDGVTCVDIDECKTGAHTCTSAQECVNVWTSFKCDDKDECELGTHKCAADADCNNTKPGYTCKCKKGKKSYYFWEM